MSRIEAGGNGNLLEQGTLIEMEYELTYRAVHKLPQIYTANHTTVLIQMYVTTDIFAVTSEAPSM